MSRLPGEIHLNVWSERLAELRAAGRELIDLTEANPTLTGLSSIGAAARAALDAGLAEAYVPDPLGLPEARRAIAAYYASRGLNADASDFVLTTGTSEGFAHLLRLLTHPGDRVLAPDPGYPLHAPLGALEGVGVEAYRLKWDGRWHLDVEEISRALAAGARAVVVVQPNHPTGSCLAPSELAALEAACEHHDAVLIADEVFGDFPWDGRRGGLPSLVGERRAHTFVLSGLSKVCGLPQLKLSWIWVGGPARARDRLLRKLEWISDLFLSVATPVQRALPVLLEERRGFQKRALERIVANRAQLAALVERRPEVSVLEAEGGWVGCLRLPSRISEFDWTLALLERGVIAHPGHFYDFNFGPIVVVSLIVQPRDFSLGLERLESLLGEG